METITKWFEDQILNRIVVFITGTAGQQRIRATVAGIVLSIAAKWGLPPSVADYAGELIAGATALLLTSWTVRKPGAPAIGSAPAVPALPPAPESADGIPGEPPTIVE